jgi:hypothetical protein
MSFGSRRHGEGEGGNREVLPLAIRAGRTDMCGAPGVVCPEEEGGPWGKHGFRHAEPQAEVAA